jgi:hypothetical protein
MEFMEYFTLAVMVIGAFIGAIVVWRRRDRTKSFHEKAGECQVFPFVFSSSLLFLFSNYPH